MLTLECLDPYLHFLRLRDVGTSQFPSFKVDTYRSEEDSVKCGTDILNQFFISNFRRVMYVVFFLLGDSPASEF